MKKIGIFTRPVDQGTSGSSHHLKEMILHFMKINDHFDVTFIHYQANSDEIYNLSQELIIPRNPFLAVKILNREKFDLIHYSPLTIYSPILGLNKRIKKVATLHGVEPILCPHCYKFVRVLHEITVIPLYSRLMNHIFTVSQTSKDFFNRRWGIKTSNMSICYNGITPSYRIKSSSDCLNTIKKYSIRKPYFFHISKFSRRKNPWTMLKAMVLLKDKNPDLSFVIAGQGWKNKQTEEFIKKNSLEDRIIFTGFTPEAHVIDLLNSASAFVFPSLAEGFGMPNIEAMACGCPVITSNVFAIPEIVGKAAYILKKNKDPNELAEAILDLMGNVEMQQKRVELGKKQIEKYSWEESAEKMYYTYGTLL